MDELASMPDGEFSLLIFNAFTLEISLDLVVAAAHYAPRKDADTLFSKMATIKGYRDVLRSSNAALLFDFYIISTCYCICSVLSDGGCIFS